MSRELLKRALDALKKYDAPSTDITGRSCRKPIDDILCNDIMKALAQPEAEPVAWYSVVVNDCITAEKKAGRIKLQPWDAAQYDVPLYATPQAQPIDGFGGNLDSAFDAAPVPAWLPIESAPKDGKEVLLLVKLRAGIRGKCLVGHHMEGGHCIEDHPPIDSGWYFWSGCMFDKAAEPTHWMPLPPAPGSAPAVPAVQVVLRQPNLFASAPAAPAVPAVQPLIEGDTLVLRLRGRARYLRDVGEHKSAQLLDEAAQRIQPALFCPRCRVDRLTSDCPNRIGCPMVAEAHGITQGGKHG